MILQNVSIHYLMVLWEFQKTHQLKKWILVLMTRRMKVQIIFIFIFFLEKKEEDDEEEKHEEHDEEDDTKSKDEL